MEKENKKPENAPAEETENLSDEQMKEVAGGHPYGNGVVLVGSIPGAGKPDVAKPFNPGFSREVLGQPSGRGHAIAESLAGAKVPEPVAFVKTGSVLDIHKFE